MHYSYDIDDNAADVTDIFTAQKRQFLCKNFSKKTSSRVFSI